MTQNIVDRPPSKVLRFGLRFPIWLFRLKLDWLLGNRFLLLTHTGRKSGKPRQTILEVVQHDKRTDAYYVVSGWAEKSNWYQNIRETPQVTIQAGGRKFQAHAEFVPLAQEMEIMEAYAHDHPIAFGELTTLFLGKRLKAVRDDVRFLTQKMPMIAFHPKRTSEVRE